MVKLGGMRTIRELDEDELGELMRITEQAFPGMKVGGTAEREAILERLRRVQQGGFSHFYGVFEAAQMVGVMRNYDFTMKLHETRTLVGGVGGVAVDLRHKKERVAADMIAHFLRVYVDKGAALTALYPFRPDFYRRMGFGYGVKLNRYSFPPDALPTGRPRARVEYLTAADSEETFEVEEREDDAQSGSFLLVRMPRALLSPVKLLVDAEWHQPWFAREAVGKLRIAAPYRSLEGLSLQTLVPVRPPQETLLRRDTQGLLVLLALRMKSQLTRPELLRVLDVLGTISGSPYQRMPSLLRELNVEIVLDSALRGSGLCHRYRATLNRYAEHEEALVWHFCTRLQELLDYWNAEASVELTVDAGGLILSSPLPGRLPETPVAG